MADGYGIYPLKGSHMHFSGTGAETVYFARGVTTLYITTDASTTISFDGGVNFMTMTANTHVFINTSIKQLAFGAGTWSGVGISS